MNRMASKKNLIKNEKKITMKNQGANNFGGIGNPHDKTQHYEQQKYSSGYIDDVIEPINLFNHNKARESVTSRSS
jgi:hypothetical protein